MASLKFLMLENGNGMLADKVSKVGCAEPE